MLYFCTREYLELTNEIIASAMKPNYIFVKYDKRKCNKGLDLDTSPFAIFF